MPGIKHQQVRRPGNKQSPRWSLQVNPSTCKHQQLVSSEQDRLRSQMEEELLTEAQKDNRQKNQQVQRRTEGETKAEARTFCPLPTAFTDRQTGAAKRSQSERLYLFIHRNIRHFWTYTTRQSVARLSSSYQSSTRRTMVTTSTNYGNHKH